MALKTLKVNNNKVVTGGSNRANKTVVNSSKNLTYMPNIKAIKESTFLIFNTKKTFNYLKQAFIKTSML